jgi:predicted alpha/beta hydrolase
MYFPTADVATLDDVELADVERVTFETTDGLRLGGWFVRASGPPPHVTVLVFNGNAGNRSHRVPLAAALHQHGLQVLLVDYRGYSGNPGMPTEKEPAMRPLKLSGRGT